MELQTIKTFLTIVRLGNFQRAANELQYAQSSITMQIQKLEKQLGLKLFERGKKIQLTEAGKIFAEQAFPIIKNLDQLQNTMNDLLQGEAGSIRIGAIEPAASLYLPKIIFPYIVAHPKIELSINIGYTHTFSKLIHKQEMDFAICSVPDNDNQLVFEPLFSEPLTLLVSDKHPISKKEIVHLEDLQSQRFVVTSKDCPYRKKIETTLQERGSSYSILEISNLAAIKYYVKENYGLAYIPSSIFSLSAFPETSIKEVNNLNMEIITGILYNNNPYVLSVASKKIIQHIKQGFNSLKGLALS
ncbi:MAG: transcriptional regulator, LysR family [Firmicutes bacterium]|nr:transcriptional regulator, LysR family [Bacillota bacterium]